MMNEVSPGLDGWKTVHVAICNFREEGSYRSVALSLEVKTLMPFEQATGGRGIWNKQPHPAKGIARQLGDLSALVLPPVVDYGIE